MSETKGQIIVAARLEQREREFQMMSRFYIFSRELMGDSLDPMRNAGLARIWRCLDVRPHRGQLAAHVAADP